MTRMSIVLPTYNRKERLKMVLTSLQNQNYPMDQFEVLVVSDGSTDGTDQYLQSFRPPYRLRVINQENQGVASARNTGIRCAEGEIVVFIDDDTVPAPNLLMEHERIHRLQGRKTVVIGPMLAPPDHRQAPWVRWEQSRLMEQYRDMSEGRWSPSPRQFFTANASIARQHLCEAGGFDPAIRRAEDVELAYRLDQMGARFIFHPDAVVFHYAERSFESWVAIPYAYGVNDVIFSQKKGQNWLLPTIFKEYHSRHPLIKWSCWVNLDRTLLSNLTELTYKSLIHLSDQLGLSDISHLACGAIFNQRYYQGVADGLGGRNNFFKSAEAAKPRQVSRAW